MYPVIAILLFAICQALMCMLKKCHQVLEVNEVNFFGSNVLSCHFTFGVHIYPTPTSIIKTFQTVNIQMISLSTN